MRKAFLKEYKSFSQRCGTIEGSLINIAVLRDSVNLAGEFITAFLHAFQLFIKSPAPLLVPNEALETFKTVITSAIEEYANNQLPSTNKEELPAHWEWPSDCLVPLDKSADDQITSHFPTIRSSMPYRLPVNPDSGILARGIALFGTNLPALAPVVKDGLNKLSSATRYYRRRVLRDLNSSFRRLPLKWKRGLKELGHNRIDKIDETQKTLIKRLRVRLDVIEAVLFALDQTTNSSLPAILLKKGLPEDVFIWLRDCFGATLAKGVLGLSSDDPSSDGPSNCSMPALEKMLSHKLPLPKWLTHQGAASSDKSTLTSKKYPYVATVLYLENNKSDSSAAHHSAWNIFKDCQKNAADRRLSKVDALAKALDTNLPKAVLRKIPPPNKDKDKDDDNGSTISSSLSSSLLSGDVPSDMMSADDENPAERKDQSDFLKRQPQWIQNHVRTDPLLSKIVLDPAISDCMVTKSHYPERLPGYFDGIWPDHYPRITLPD